MSAVPLHLADCTLWHLSCTRQIFWNDAKSFILLVFVSLYLFFLVQAAWGSRRWERSSCMGSLSWAWRTLSTSFTHPKSAWTCVISRIHWRLQTSCRSCLSWGSVISFWAVRWEQSLFQRDVTLFWWWWRCTNSLMEGFDIQLHWGSSSLSSQIPLSASLSFDDLSLSVNYTVAYRVKYI